MGDFPLAREYRPKTTAYSPRPLVKRRNFGIVVVYSLFKISFIDDFRFLVVGTIPGLVGTLLMTFYGILCEGLQ
jgi:hypothetical protein